jgi:hypothetical protein
MFPILGFDELKMTHNPLNAREPLQTITLLMMWLMLAICIQFSTNFVKIKPNNKSTTNNRISKNRKKRKIISPGARVQPSSNFHFMEIILSRRSSIMLGEVYKFQFETWSIQERKKMTRSGFKRKFEYGKILFGLPLQFRLHLVLMQFNISQRLKSLADDEEEPYIENIGDLDNPYHAIFAPRDRRGKAKQIDNPSPAQVLLRLQLDIRFVLLRPHEFKSVL